MNIRPTRELFEYWKPCARSGFAERGDIEPGASRKIPRRQPSVLE